MPAHQFYLIVVHLQVTNKKVLDKRRQGGEITEDAFIYMVLEFGEIDLAGILSDKLKKLQGNSDRKLDENWLRYNWQVYKYLYIFIAVVVQVKMHFLLCFCVADQL